MTVTVNVPAVMESDAKMLLVCIETATVESDEEYLTLTNALGQMKKRRNAYEADRIKLKKPVLQLGKDIEEIFRTPLLILHSAIALGKQKLLAYDAIKRAEAGANAALANAAGEVQAGAEAAKREAEEAVAVVPRAAMTAAAAAQFASRAQVPAVLGNSQRRSRPMSWGWRVTDIDKIAPKWYTLDVRAIDKVMAEHGGDSLALLGEGFDVMSE